MRHLLGLGCLLSLIGTTTELSAQTPKNELVPHAQDKPPGPALSPTEAIKKMTVPEGFSVEVVAAEPDIVNPVAMTIDERGRFWITESLEYPRKDPGPGKDRVKILEDTDGDGRMDKFTVFMEGLNIPSGIAVGHGGVWIANSPDILYVPDADRDGKPDRPPQVVVTGFGRTDTHELPNSLTWGPDGWLYGLNGVFNFSHVTYPPESPWLKVGQAFQPDPNAPQDVDSKNNAARLTGQPGKADLRTEFKFTCAMFRIHPRTREFQVFAEGTSNPWGIAFNDEGEAFVSACVIDHLWHIVETGYYHRQGGPYPPFTWKIDSIVKHKHQKAAYCGIHYFDSDAYPEQYRGKLYMGNIHGGCINVDKLQRDGSTYFATGEPDFLTANDAWFMPVVQKTGPDGCLYILDWYDRYHCYQDANRDPAGIDRLKGRLYRVRYNGKGERGDVSPPSPPAKSTDAKKEGSAGGKKENPTARTKENSAAEKNENSADLRQAARLYPQMDLAKETDEQLIERLGANNDFIRWTATRLLQERTTPEVIKELLAKVEAGKTAATMRRHSLFSLAGMESEANTPALEKLIHTSASAVEDREFLVSWTWRMMADHPRFRSTYSKRLENGIAIWPDKASPTERLQTVIWLSKLPTNSLQVLDGLMRQLSQAGDDKLIPRIVWQNLHSRLETHPNEILAYADSYLDSKPVADLMPRVADRILGRQKFDAQPIGKLFALLRDDYPQVGRQVLEIISAKVQSGELKGEKLDQLKAAMEPELKPMLGVESKHPLRLEASLLALSWGDRGGAVGTARMMVLNKDEPPAQRLAAYNALIAAKDGCVAQVAREVLRRKPQESPAFIADFVAALARMDSGKLEREVGDEVVTRFAELPPELQPRAIELLTQRAAWAKPLLKAVGEKKIAATAINLNQARRLKELKDAELTKLLDQHWGQVRDGRSPDREKIIAEMKSLIRQKPGDPFAGEKTYKKVCGQCHKIYGEGAEVGPDITLNGRNDFTQLLSNVFDPSLVIGAGYRSFTVVTQQGRVINGLLAEDSPQRIVLKVQGGKQEMIARDDIDEFKVQEISLMPEQVEKQLTPQEIVDLFAFITLDKHPSDKTAKQLPGVRAPTPRAATNPGEFGSLLNDVLPGFTTTEVGEGGLAILADHFGREGVLRTHPISRDKPCVLTQKISVPAGKTTRILIDVSHDPHGDWRLVIRGNGERLADEMISKETCRDGWRTITVDLSKFAGQDFKLDLVNQANDWSYEFGYWGPARIVIE